MKAVVLEQNEVLNYRDIPKPEPDVNDVLIKVAVCGICGSDVPRVYDNAARSYPMVLGHEFSGVVEQIGKNVTSVKVGDHVVAVPLIPCMECIDCKKGDYALCKKYSFIGSRQQGAMADYIVVPAVNVLEIPKSLSFEQVATIEPATVALHAFRHCKVEEGRRVAILGCGIIGLYAVQWARILGASDITAISRGKRGLDTAIELGATQTISTEEFSDSDICKMCESGFDYVFECSGSKQTMELALKLVANKSVVCYVGTPKKELTFSVALWEQINRKECSITGTWMSYSAPFPGEEWTMTIDAMKSMSLIYVPELIDHAYNMKDAKTAFDSIRNGVAKGRVLLSNLGVEK